MRPLLLAALVLCLPAFASAADQDTPATRRAAAARYLEVSDTRKMINDTAVAMAQNLPSDQATAFKDVLMKQVNIETVNELMITGMVKHFTTRELDALADFYGSPEGRSTLAKFGPYVAEVMPLMQAELLRAAEAAKATKADKPGS